MRAIYLDRKAGTEGLVLGDISTPKPADGEVLVRVHATAVMPTELQWFPTFNLKSGEPRPFPVVLSHEFSGVVESTGANAGNVKPGDEVYGLNDWFTNGAQAEYCVVAATGVTRKPKSLDHVHSAVVPISALTAWQGLFDHGNLQTGQRVLIHGAAGGVGAFAVQLARWRGARVIATTSSANVEFVRELGADEVIDYRESRFEEVLREIDLVLDGVGGETLERSWGALKQGGKLVTFATQSESNSDKRAREAFMLVEANAAQLGKIGDLIDAGLLRVFVAEEFPLAKAGAAYTRAEKGNLRGKIALRVD